MEKVEYIPKNRKYDFKVPIFKTKTGEIIYLNGFSWDCDWYWGGGYMGNKDLHTHFDSIFFERKKPGSNGFFSEEYDNSELLIPSKDMCILLDLYRYFYLFQEMADANRHIRYTEDTDTFLKNLKIQIQSNDMYLLMNKKIEEEVISAIVSLVKTFPEKVEKKQKSLIKIKELKDKYEKERKNFKEIDKGINEEIRTLEKDI